MKKFILFAIMLAAVSISTLAQDGKALVGPPVISQHPYLYKQMDGNGFTLSAWFNKLDSLTYPYKTYWCTDAWAQMDGQTTIYYTYHYVSAGTTSDTISIILWGRNDDSLYMPMDTIGPIVAGANVPTGIKQGSLSISAHLHQLQISVYQPFTGNNTTKNRSGGILYLNLGSDLLDVFNSGRNSYLDNPGYGH